MKLAPVATDGEGCREVGEREGWRLCQPGPLGVLK